MTFSSAAGGPAAAPRADHEHHANTALVLLVICGAQLMIVLDATIVNIALPSIQSALGFSQTGLTWVLNAYTLAFGGLLLLGGRIGDQIGHRRSFVLGILIFTAASFVGGFAQNEAWLLVARVGQGVGGALSAPAALALITTTFEEGPERHRAFGVFSAVAGSGAAIGLILGGILTDLLSWRWVLFVNVPVGLLLAFAAPRVLGSTRPRSTRLDVTGALTVTVGMTLLVYGLVRAAEKGWTDALTLVAFVAAAVLLVAFVVVERQHRQPLVPLRTFANRNRAGAYVVMLSTAAVLFSFFFFATLYIQQILGYDPLKAGFAFMPVPVAIVTGAQLSARFLSRLGPLPFMAAGAVAVGSALLWISSVATTTSGYLDVVPPMMLLGLGLGLNFVPLTTVAVSGFATREAGLGSALLTACQQIGGSLGLAILITVSSGTIADRLGPVPEGGVPLTPDGGLPPPVAEALTSGWTHAFGFAAIFSGVALLTALLAIRVRPGAAASPGLPAH